MEGRLALLGLGLAALALRTQLTAIAPLLPAIQRELHMPHTVAGLLPALPLLCMSLFAPPALYLSRRVGTRVGIGLCIGALTVFGFVRAGVPGAALVIAATFPIGVAMGLAGMLLPLAVKERFADRPGLATGVYATGLSVGAAVGAVSAVPLAHLVGGWRGALAALSAVSLLLLPAWFLLSRGAPEHVREPERPPRLPWRSGIGWVLVVLFGIESVIFFGLSAWLPDLYVERGWSEASAGSLLAVLLFANLPTSLLVPWLADRHGSRRLFLVGASGALLAATLGFVLLPGGAYLWAVMSGAAIGALFPLMLALPLDLADDPRDVGAFVSLQLLGGYFISATGPIVLGAARDATGSYTAGLWLLVVLSAALILACLPFSRRRLARGVRPAVP